MPSGIDAAARQREIHGDYERELNEARAELEAVHKRAQAVLAEATAVFETKRRAAAAKEKRAMLDLLDAKHQYDRAEVKDTLASVPRPKLNVGRYGYGAKRMSKANVTH